MSQGTRSEATPSRLDVWGKQMMNKLPSRSRQRRKRSASKKRRNLERADIRQGIEESE